MTPQSGKYRLPWHQIIIFFFLAIGIGISGYILYENQKTAFKKREYNDLTAITNLKVQDIVNWRKERLGDAQVIQQNLPAIRRMRQLMEDPASDELKKELLYWMKSLKESYQYGSVFLLDTQKNVRLHWGDETRIIGSNTAALAEEAIHTKKIIFSDFRWGQVKHIIRLDIFVPLLIQEGQEKVPVGVLVLRIDPQQTLFSHILSWPTSSPTAAIIIAYREGDEVVVLTGPRHKKDKDTDLLVRYPISEKQSLSAMAARGEEGIVETLDCRGVPVLAAIKAIPDTSWRLIAKIDKEEVYAPIRERFWMVLILVFALIVAAGTATGLFWRHQRSRFYRKQYEVKLERDALTKHYEYLTRYANDIILMLDENWKIIEANDRAVQAYGYTRDELLQMNMQEIRDPEAPPDLNGLADMVDKRNGLVYEMVHRRKDGATFPVEISARVIEIEGNRFFQGIIRDITERKRAEKALEESEKKYRELVDFLPIAVFELDKDGEILSVNRAFLEMFFYTQQDVEKGLHAIESFIPPEDKDRVKQNLQRVLNGSVTRGNEYNVLRKDGSLFSVLISTNPVFRDGKIVGARGAIIDVTKRKRAEELYRTLAESSQVGVYITQEERFIFVNPNIVEYTGYPESELIGMNIVHLAHPDDFKTARANAIDMLKGRRSTPYEFRIIDRQGRIRWLMETVRAITYEGKRAALGNVMDVTERHHMERMLHQAQKMEAIGTLAGGIAHDFNNILTAIIGYAEMAMYKAREGGAVQRDLEQVLKAGSRATDLVKQILTFSRQTEQERKPLQVALIAKEALKLLRSSLPSTIEIHQDIAIPAEKGIVMADPTQIHQVLMNLCTNAAHAMRDRGGILSVKLSDFDADAHFVLRHPDLRPGSYLCLTVSDTGHGMDAAVLERIFDPYFTTKGPGEGTGLGLAVVQGIVKGHGGGITVYSEPDKGTVFNVFLPRIEEEIAPESLSMEALPVGDERILFIDDEKTLAELGKEILESLGYNVVTQMNGTDALEIFCARPDAFDLVITDMTMPGLTGIELARKLLAVRPDIPIILCTGFSELINEKQTKELGISEFLMKPFVTAKLAKTIRGLLDERK